MAIGRWKFKVKCKASVFSSESLKTGGGPSMALPLNAIEERPMTIYGWKSVEGDKSKTVEERYDKVHNKNILEVPPITSIENTVEVPPLIPLNEMQDKNPSTSAITASIKRKTYQNDHAAEIKKKKTATQSIKSRRFVSINKMHSE
ncbi:unnamed protein product [Psylliodes chrysocephalus]|uniref:Uncharacterized protein n=1 Tax=Psylliodes chrysocephalus TaxID=3402493 RepID=A0A9P0GAV7_9CUCU|nr:unnamed protein product [Psylliodes chrysocephala]